MAEEIEGFADLNAEEPSNRPKPRKGIAKTKAKVAAMRRRVQIRLKKIPLDKMPGSREVPGLKDATKVRTGSVQTGLPNRMYPKQKVSAKVKGKLPAAKVGGREISRKGVAETARQSRGGGRAAKAVAKTMSRLKKFPKLKGAVGMAAGKIAPKAARFLAGKVAPAAAAAQTAYEIGKRGKSMYKMHKGKALSKKEQGELGMK